jgi:hypothetical protein
VQQAHSPTPPENPAGTRRDDRPVEKTPVEARQGRRGVPMLWVLGVAVVAAAGILLLLVVFSDVYAPTPNTGLTPSPEGPFASQTHVERQPTGTKVTGQHPSPSQ